MGAKVDAARGTLTLDVDWRDRAAATRIADYLSRRFVERRRELEVDSLSRTLSVLEQHAAQSRTEVAEALREAAAQQERSNRAIAAAARTVGETPALSAERDRAKTLQALAASKAAAAALEEGWRKRLLEQRAAVEELRGRYTAENPALREAQRRLQEAEQEPRELSEAKAETARLLDRLLAQGGVASDMVDGGASRRGAAQAALSASLLERDPEVAHARRRLEAAEAEHAALAARLEAARVEYQTAREAFPGRYVLVQPATVPVAPSPTTAAILLAGLVGGLLLALLSVLAAHLAEGRIHHVWQLERQLGLKVLGEVELPRPGGVP